MTTKTFIVLFIFLTLSVIKVHCVYNFSTPQSNLSSTALDKADAKNKTLPDQLPSQLNVYLEKGKENRTKSWEDELYAKLAGADMLKFSRLLPGFITKSGPAYVLNLNNNHLKSLSPGIFDDLQGLKGLLLNNNNLGSLNASIFRGLHSLENLELDANNLSDLPNDVFLELINLKTITLNANQFSSLPADLFVHNKKLKTVELKENKVNMTDLPSKLFNSFVDLENVVLQSIGLQQLSEDLFWNSCKLKEIDLSKNNLKALPKKLLNHAHELITLNLSSNHLTSLPNGFFTVAGKLHQLDLSNNNIMALNKWDVFVGLHSLRMINVESNGLEMIHADAFISLPNLKIARFAHNHLNLTSDLCNLFGQVSAFRHCPLLEELDLSYNNVSQIYKDWIVEHTLLRRLDLSHNNFGYLESKDLLFNSSNLYVDLSHNAIKIVNLTQLGHKAKNSNSSRDVTINLNYNPMECYCEAYSLERYITKDQFHFIQQENLNYVKLLTDNLSCNAPESYRGTLLKDLAMSSDTALSCSVENGRSTSCASAGACDCYIIPNRRLLHLDCDRRNLTEAPAWINGWGIYEAHVNLSGNALRTTPDLTKGAWTEIHSIRLDLSKNNIDRIENNHSVPNNLNELNLNYNKITSIDLELVKFLTHRLRRLEIRENPWLCNQQTLAFRDEVRASYLYEGGYVWWDVWDMKDFTCDNNTQTRAACGTQLKKEFTKTEMIVYSTLAFLLFIVHFLAILLYFYRRQIPAKSLQGMENERQENSAKV